MGSESSSLRGFTLQDPPWSQPSGLTIYPALLQDGRLASVFVYQLENQEKVDKAAKHLKTLRHPCLLRFLLCTVEEDGIYLVTERVQPLEMLLEKLTSDEICAGIYDILQALVFLHDRGKVSHNNVCLSSLFVSEDGHWKLGGMEMVCKLTEVVPESAEFGVVPVSLSHARDAFLFGRLVENLLTHVKDQTDVLSSFKNMVKNCLLNPEPELRPALSSLLSHDYFRNHFLEIVNFLESLTVKSEEEKNEFFKFLLDRVATLPEELISSRLVPLLLNQFVFAEPMAVKSFLPHLLRPKRDIMGRNREDCLLSPPLFQTRVIPVLMKMFEVHEEHVRVVLLTHIDAYGELFTLKELKDIILPQVLLGLRDTSDLLVAVTLRGLAALVCLLGPEVVVGGGRVKIFKSTTPGFTKMADATPEGSPVHGTKNHVHQATSNSLSSVLSKSNFAVNHKSLINTDLNRKESLKEILQEISIQKDCFSHSLNGVSKPKDSLLTDQVQQSTEDWPDWSESEGHTSEKILSVHDNTETNDRSEMEQWIDFSLPCDSSRTVTTAADTFVKLSSAKPVSELDKSANSRSFHTVKENKESKPDPVPDPVPEQVPKIRFESEYGLGDEFTIKVRSKSKDPELDWFADMTPEINISSAFSASGYHEFENKTQTNVITDSEQTDSFSSKFAAAENTEMEAEGWGEENDFSWEEDANNL
ncbi:protein-associating with the carboxyl-terminal domain of ezrin isoform X2 [Rana temporaria]|uniref:protein-associating with the carboxyl-terminal domain of ezrin isoform X2 n=1 Tax=Rana temporaria TaxID=8407 RepID=UPI001AAD132C|nr:protein-associating with the carboxyl-terminal domain of ezrin isoform X2 [Rana temporaria]